MTYSIYAREHDTVIIKNEGDVQVCRKKDIQDKLLYDKNSRQSTKSNTYLYFQNVYILVPKLIFGQDT